mgnify:CR=1 FL=1
MSIHLVDDDDDDDDDVRFFWMKEETNKWWTLKLLTATSIIEEFDKQQQQQQKINQIINKIIYRKVEKKTYHNHFSRMKRNWSCDYYSGNPKVVDSIDFVFVH